VNYISDVSEKFKEKNVPIEAVIFDLDGILVDTEPLYFEANDQLLSKYGKRYNNELQNMVIGKTERDGGLILIKELELPITVEEYLEKHHQILQELFPTCKVMNGVLRLLRHLVNNNFKIAVATSSKQESVVLKIKNHQSLFELFKGNVITGDNPKVKKGKPSPDIYLAMAEQLKVDPSKCLVFEDSPAGVESGKAAGMTVVGIPLPHIYQHRREHYDSCCSLVLNTMADFLPEIYGLPTYSEEK